MARNKLEDLRDHLFAQLERLSDEEISSEQLEKEIQRAKSINSVSRELIEIAKVEVDFLQATGQLKGSQFFSQINPQNQLPNAD